MRHPVITRPSRAAWIAGVIVSGYVVLLWTSGARRGNIHTGDTDNLVLGTRALDSCLRSRTWNACGLHPGTRFTDVFPYPLLQYLPSLAFVRQGWNDADILGALARLNLFAFLAALVLIACAFPRVEQRHLRALALAALIGSSATFQSTAGFGEMLAAMFVLAVVVAALRGNAALLFFAALLACLGKETLFPFVIGFGFLAGRSTTALLPRARVLVALIGGALAGAAVGFLFNVLRFGTPRNLLYLDPKLSTPGIRNKFSFFIGQWFSPSAGIFAFWPVAALLLTFAGVVGVSRLIHAPRNLARWVSPVAVVVLCAGFTAGLSAWFAPFGWITYGPRLAVPVLPAASVVALHVAADEFGRAAWWIGVRWWRIALVAASLITISWPQYGAPWSHVAAVNRLIAADSTCPAMTAISIDRPDEYYRCAKHIMWRFEPSPVLEAATAGGKLAMLARATAAVFCTVVLVQGLRGSRMRYNPRSDPPGDAPSAPPLDDLGEKALVALEH